MARRLTGLIDSALAIIAPRRAAMRLHLRRMETDTGYREIVLAMLNARGYRSAKAASNQTPWVGGARSADAELLTDLPTLRSRSREINRDDPIGSGLTESFVKNIIGTGLRFQARTGDLETNRRIESLWNERADGLHPADDLIHAEVQAMLMRKVLEDGEILIKDAKRFPDEPVWFEIIEADRLATPVGPVQKLQKGHTIRDGVEKDGIGIPVAYWIRKYHPGDTLQRPTASAQDFARIDKRNICHLRIAKRPGQTRGEPAFHAILQNLRDLDLLIEASLKRVQVSACLGVFIRSPAATDEMLSVTAKDKGYQLDQDLVPGMIFKLNPEEDISTVVPNFPTPSLEPFVIMLARRIGAALGVSWQIVVKDFSKSNYSSARTDLLESRQTFLFFRSWFITRFLKWQARIVLSDARLRGDRRMAGLTGSVVKMQWIADGWRWVDPVKEAKAVELALAMGVTSLIRECAKLGVDFEEIVEEQKIVNETLLAAGLVPASAGSSPASGKAPADSAGGNGQAAAKRAVARRLLTTAIERAPHG